MTDIAVFMSKAKAKVREIGDLKPFVLYEDLVAIASEMLGGNGETKNARDISDNGMERWLCPCGRVAYEKEEICQECGARLKHKESLL